jgi:hypothetical protein
MFYRITYRLKCAPVADRPGNTGSLWGTRSSCAEVPAAHREGEANYEMQRTSLQAGTGNRAHHSNSVGGMGYDLS